MKSTAVTKDQALTILRACGIFTTFNFPPKPGIEYPLTLPEHKRRDVDWSVAWVRKLPEKSTYGKPLYEIDFR